MSTISVSNINDGDAVTAASVNNQVNTVVNDYNGNITDANISASAAIGAQKLAGGISGMFGAFATWTPSFTGFSANPASGLYYYIQVGKIICAFISQPNSGTSNANTFTLTLPTTPRTITSMQWSGSGQILDNSATGPTPGLLLASSGSNILSVYPSYSGGLWTTSGGKRLVSGTIIYETA